MLSKYALIVLFLLNIIGCSATKKQEIVFDKPKIQIPKKEPIVKRNKGSLYSMRGASLFADKKDLQVGDIIQIQIQEKLKSNSKNKRELKNSSSTNLGGGVFSNANKGLTGKIADELNNNIGIGFNTKRNNSDKGEVKTQLDETFSTTISAIIEQTYQNGNYFIKGAKELLIEGQKQKIIISGVIRPYDITSDNSINSSQIANLKLMYDKEGEEADVLGTPWGLKLIRWIWPF